MEKVYMDIVGDKVVLKPYSLEMCHAFYRKYRSDPMMTYDEYVYDLEKVNQFYTSKVLDKSRCFFAIYSNNIIIGEIQLKRINYEEKSCALSIHLSCDKYKGLGYGSEAEKLIIEFAKLELRMKTIYADTVHRNSRSKHILQKLSFIYLYDDNNLSYFKLDVL